TLLTFRQPCPRRRRRLGTTSKRMAKTPRAGSPATINPRERRTPPAPVPANPAQHFRHPSGPLRKTRAAKKREAGGRGPGATMQAFIGVLAKLHALLRNRVVVYVVRGVAVLSMSFAAAFGFLAAMTSPGAHYDPHSFAIGAAALFGAACGAIGLLV